MVIDEQKYRSIARELRKEKKLLAQLMTHCHTRYAYAPVYDAMEKGANAIEELLDAVSNVSCSHLPSNSLLIGSDELLSALFQESNQQSIPLSQIDAFAQFVKLQYALGKAFRRYEVVGLDIELPAVFRTIQRRPDRLLLSGTAVCLTQRLCTPVNPELSCMAKKFTEDNFRSSQF